MKLIHILTSGGYVGVSKQVPVAYVDNDAAIQDKLQYLHRRKRDATECHCKAQSKNTHQEIAYGKVDEVGRRRDRQNDKWQYDKCTHTRVTKTQSADMQNVSTNATINKPIQTDTHPEWNPSCFLKVTQPVVFSVQSEVQYIQSKHNLFLRRNQLHVSANIWPPSSRITKIRKKNVPSWMGLRSRTLQGNVIQYTYTDMQP
jgi:hypothetical protein